ncbi:hypothetical protein CDD83_4215 [Cordyceps sp. RAO-2017]|nr:hypothetical protein CDD83_4215 [Cordyceps sp. RAO-2017]
MSGPINIGSSSEWQSLLSDTNVVVADCTEPPLPSRPSREAETKGRMLTGRERCLSCSLRRLVRPVQDDRARVRAPVQGTLAPQAGGLCQGQRRQPVGHRARPGRLRHADLQDLPQGAVCRHDQGR